MPQSRVRTAEGVPPPGLVTRTSTHSVPFVSRYASNRHEPPPAVSPRPNSSLADVVEESTPAGATSAPETARTRTAVRRCRPTGRESEPAAGRKYRFGREEQLFSAPFPAGVEAAVPRPYVDAGEQFTSSGEDRMECPRRAVGSCFLVRRYAVAAQLTKGAAHLTTCPSP